MSNQKAGPGYLEVIAIALVVAIGVIYGYDRFFAQKIRVVDLKGFMRSQKALVKAGQITPEQWKANLDALDRRLAEEAERYPNQVIILKDVVLKNGDEISVSSVR